MKGGDEIGDRGGNDVLFYFFHFLFQFYEYVWGVTSRDELDSRVTFDSTHSLFRHPTKW